MQEHLIYNLISRMEHGFGTLEEGQRHNRQAAEQRSRDLHKRMDRFEDHTKSEFRDLRSKMERSKAPAPASPTSYLKVVGSLLAHWQIILTVVLVAAGLALGKSPETIKAWVGALKQ